MKLLERVHSELVSEYWQPAPSSTKQVQNGPEYEDYQNFLDSSLTQSRWSKAYFPQPGTFERLVRAQKRYNPSLAVRGSSLHTVPAMDKGGGACGFRRERGARESTKVLHR